MSAPTSAPQRPAPAAGQRPRDEVVVRRPRTVSAWLSGSRAEPWRDWAALAAFNHTFLLVIAFTHPADVWLLPASLMLGAGLATATLTVLHDAGHQRFSRAAWPNIFAVHSAAPVGLWVSHWTLKHRVHHRVAQVYPLDDATRASGLVRLHPAAPKWPIHRWQHWYAWLLYGLAWAGELRSQLTYLRSGRVDGTTTPHIARRLVSFVAEKALCLLALAPYIWLLGPGRLTVLLLGSMTVASVLAAVATVVGHINLGLDPPATAPAGADWPAHLVRTTASFSTESRAVRWLTGGLTHHLAHHLRPAAPRSDLPQLHRTVITDIAHRAGLEPVAYPAIIAAIRGHTEQLRELGRPNAPNDTAVRATRPLLVHGSASAGR